jgi:hypothetical protein
MTNIKYHSVRTVDNPVPVSGEIKSTVLPSLKYLYNTTVKISVDILIEKYLNLNVESGIEEKNLT